MFGLRKIAARVFGTTNDRKIARYRARVCAINALEEQVSRLSDAELKDRTRGFREELAQGKSLDDLLVPAFATVREAAKRTIGQRHFDVQLMGGMVLHEGSIAEMKTGEGKTLVATLPVYLNALSGQGVHVVTVNDYLAKRDAAWMSQIYDFLGLSTGIIVHDLTDAERRHMYGCDVTYATNNELGFDYLRDNMKYHLEEMVQRGHGFAIIDEVDSILIDEARTPLIISGPVDDKSGLYNQVDQFIPPLTPEDYDLDEKQRTVSLTECGNEHLEQILAQAGLLNGNKLYDGENVTIVHHVQQALRAHKMFQRDKDYIVRNDEIIIIDEFTGRMMPGRRYSEGLHQALEAKEHVTVQPENVTLASITFQNYFRLYQKLGGMTGTALTEAEEFLDIYKLEVIEIPTNVAVARRDEDDEVYRTAREKYAAIIATIKEASARGQPILVGTTSIEKSEHLANLLSKEKIKHNVLNARYHEQEASIVAQAGAPGAVTIATNMAGRGTDIQLGGNVDMRIATELNTLSEGPERLRMIEKIKQEVAENKQKVRDAGGLFVIGTERHESRRIDNQLRGRSGRQGDPGWSRFYLSLEDDLMRIFGSQRMDSMLQKLGLKEGEAIIHPWINKALAKAQQKVEARNFDIRKNVLKYDDVMNDQRKVIFEQRIGIMRGEEVSETIDDMRHETIVNLIARHIPENSYAAQWRLADLQQAVKENLALDLPIEEWGREEGIAEREITERLVAAANQAYSEKRERFGASIMNQIEKALLLQCLDQLWRDHIITIDQLRQIINLRGYGQRDPLSEFKTEAFNLFTSMVAKLQETTTVQLMYAEVQLGAAHDLLPMEDELPPMVAHHVDATTGEDDAQGVQVAFGTTKENKASQKRKKGLNPKDPKSWGLVARNDSCPCGSGKRYKHCHGSFV